ncbi:putative anti-sigma regulatory factor,serine/threonine protein kinase [Rhodococcus sp. AW25M09]|uniref:ATP-binding protein n=1 Tax=Rhodococcus sp. AW25M09 TaxID=1268303 RepID=UPI0002AC404A|nr:ATP-binding protein [Rhodococcus sp. AW25M09]CCQ13495.1 putative anti-sigma regulatory factor,serine/threonine protein kinase [Rhodococcus sp. AW25M09]
MMATLSGGDDSHSDSSISTAGARMEELLFTGEPADADRASELRRELGEWLDGVGVDQDRAYDVVLATYEAIANSVEHAYRDHSDRGTLDIRVLCGAEGRIDVKVTDRGDWASHSSDPNRGRGVPLMRALADSAAVTSDESGTTVHMIWDALQSS